MYADLKGACLNCYSTVEDITRNASDTTYTQIYAHILYPFLRDGFSQKSFAEIQKTIKFSIYSDKTVTKH